MATRSTGIADVIIAETGADMTVFPTAKHLASWAGTAPGSNESAGKVKSAKTRPGTWWLSVRGSVPRTPHEAAPRSGPETQRLVSNVRGLA
jgi:hypothetical protein